MLRGRVPQASASVCKRSRVSGSVSESIVHPWQSKMVAKRRTVVTFGLAFGRLLSKVPTVTAIGEVLVAKRRERGERGEKRRDRGVERGDGRQEEREERKERR